MLRYGLFKLAQIWTITDENSARLGFLNRDLAVAALTTILAVHRAAHQDVMVAIQEEGGGLRTLLNPLETDVLKGTANDDHWDALLGAATFLNRPIVSADNDEADR